MTSPGVITAGANGRAEVAGEIQLNPEAALLPANPAPLSTAGAVIGANVAGRGHEASRRRWIAARGMRPRVLASFVVLLAIWSLLSILALDKILVLGLEDRTTEALQQEALELERLLADGRDPQTGRPFATGRGPLLGDFGPWS